MAFHVEVTPQAEQDADTILEWLLSQHAGETGIREIITGPGHRFSILGLCP